VYVVEQNSIVKFTTVVYHRLYFTHNLKDHIIKPHRKILKKPAANIVFRVLT